MHTSDTTDGEPGALDLAHVQALARAALTSVLGEGLSIELGFPQCHDAYRLGNARPAPAALVALALTPGVPEGGPWLWLTAALAANAVDRALGGCGQVGVASAAALLSDEECGVLAYLAAKTARPFSNVWIRDVIATSEPPPPAAMLWPITFRWEGGSGDAFLGWPRVRPSLRAACQIGWYDGLSPADETALVPGDVLLCDDIPVSPTTEGLAGHCVLRANGIVDTLHVALDGTRLAGRHSERKAARTEGVFVVVQEVALTLEDLGHLAAGGLNRLRASASHRVRLLRGTREFACGDLVRCQGALGVRITSIPPTLPHPL